MKKISFLMLSCIIRVVGLINLISGNFKSFLHEFLIFSIYLIISYEKYPDNKEQIGGNFFGVLNLKFSIKSSSIFSGLPLMSILLLALNDQNKIFPVKRHENEEASIFVDLLYITSKNNAHYVLVKNRVALLRTQSFKHAGATFTCDNCLCFFYLDSALKHHKELCYLKDPHVASYPNEGEKLKFTKYEHQVRKFVVS